MTLKQQYFNIRLYTTFSQLKCLFLEPKCLTTIYVCFADTHSLDHMFLHCSSVAAFWKTFQNWWTNKTKQQLTLSNSMILYGVFDKILFELCASNCKIYYILQLPARRKVLFRQFSHTYSKQKIKYTEKNLKTSLLLLSKNPFNILLTCIDDVFSLLWLTK